MSTDPSISRHDSAAGGEETPHPFVPPTGPPDPAANDLVDQAKSEILQLVSEIRELSQAEMTQQAFFEGFLARVIHALAAAGGAIWLNDPGSRQRHLACQVNLPASCLPPHPAVTSHQRLLDQVARVEAGQLVPPQTEPQDDDRPANPTEFLLIVVPLRIDQQPVGLVEIFQRTGANRSTQAGYLHFAHQVGELASQFLRNQKLRSLSEQQAFWQDLEQFGQVVHQGLDLEQTLYQVANEGRRLVGCDRVSVALQQGKECQVRAVSGLDSIERRAEQVKRLGELATLTLQTGEPFWLEGETSSWPPQLRHVLEAYQAIAHPRWLAILPLRETEQAVTGEAPASAVGRPIGALIIEQLKESQVDPAMKSRAELIVPPSQSALGNALRYDNLFLLPLWKTLGQVRERFRGEHRARTLTCLGLATGFLALLTLIPYPLKVRCSGQLVPESQYQVFAQVDGILQEIPISEENLQTVQAGQVLARMTNNDLMVQIQNLQGQINQVREQRRKLERAMHERMEPVDDIMMEGERIKTEQAEISLRRELDLKREQARKLEILCPADGQIVNWKVRQQLLGRPVEKGQALMTVVDPQTTWQVELEIPERKMGHLMERLQQDAESPTVEFTLASLPGREFTGRLKSVDLKLDVYSDTGNSALAWVEFESAEIPPGLLRSGTRATAKIGCGSGSIGYVWFHEFFETVQATFLKWF
ncbi:MAG: efflux RND transporter periplasmic adaptor subunit [Mariniblastus sp.]|nr:efflux RND transporter periplasmic adaptor subunit [Mariniblastus sp.]